MKVFDLKPGDLVEVSFGDTSPAVMGLFVEYDERCASFTEEGASYWSRAMVFWDGEIFSTPVNQIEVIRAA